MAKESMKDKMAGNLSGSLVPSKSGRKALFGVTEEKPQQKPSRAPSTDFEAKLQVPVTLKQEGYLKEQARILHGNRTGRGSPVNQNNLVRTLIDICMDSGVSFSRDDILMDVEKDLYSVVKSRLKESL